MTGMGWCSDSRWCGLSENGRQSVASWVAKTMVPEIHGGGGEVVVGGWCCDRVEVAAVITSENHLLCLPFLNRKAKMIKLNVNWIITG